MHKHVNKQCKLIVSFVFFAAQLSKSEWTERRHLHQPRRRRRRTHSLCCFRFLLSSPAWLVTLKCFCYCFCFFFCGSTMWLSTHCASASEMVGICTLSCFCCRRQVKRGQARRPPRARLLAR